MLELDLILLPFIENSIDKLNPAQLLHLETLLNQSDPELLSWLMKETCPLNMDLRALIELILSKH